MLYKVEHNFLKVEVGKRYTVEKWSRTEMLTLIITITFFTVLVTGLLAFVPSGFFKRGYYYGVTFWSRWLPVIAVGVVFVLIITNLIGMSHTYFLSLYPTLSLVEVGVLLFILPFFFTSNVCFFSYSAFLYLFIKFLFATQVPSFGCILLISCFIIIGILSDKLPWVVQTRSSSVKTLREFLIGFVCIGLLGVVAYTIFNLSGFIKWMEEIYKLHLGFNTWIFIVVAIFGGWIFTILGFGRRFSLPILCYPSLIFVAWITNWPSYFLIIPFTILMTLALSETDRRTRIREE